MAVLTEIVSGVRSMLPESWHVERVADDVSVICPPPDAFAPTIVVQRNTEVPPSLDEVLAEVDGAWTLDGSDDTADQLCGHRLYVLPTMTTSMTGELRRRPHVGGGYVTTTLTCATSSLPDRWRSLASVVEELELS